MSTRYVWEKWNKINKSYYEIHYDVPLSVGHFYTRSFDKISIDEDTGTITLSGYYVPSSPWDGYGCDSKFISGTGTNRTAVITLSDANAYRSDNFRWPVEILQKAYENDASDYRSSLISAVQSTKAAKGSTSYGLLSSDTSSTYPADNYKGSYWYVYQGSDSIDPTISYPSSVFKNQNVKITVSPASNTYGGTISYKYEYTTDGSTWTTANSSTTATSVDVTIPSTATTFQARVTASDNRGFTSTTAVAGASIPVYDIDPTAVTYDTEAVSAGSEITVTITPSESGYSGTITYVIQTNIDGTGWETETESTSANVILTIPSDAVSWGVRVYAKAEDYTSSTYVYGNDTTDQVEVKHGAGFNVLPENKYLGYLGSAELMQYYVSTEDNVGYVCTATLDGETILNATQNPGTKILTIDTDTWEGLSQEIEHTIAITATCGGKSISRTYTFNKFVYDASTLPGLLEGIAEAIKVKTGSSRKIWGYRLPMEILKITNTVDNAITAYIDITVAYVSGMKVVAVSSSGEVYSADADSSGVTRLEVAEKGDYIVTAKIGDVPSESKKVSISTDGEVGTASVSFISLTVSTKSGASVSVSLDSYSFTGTATGGSVLFYLPQKGTWSVTATSGDQTKTETVEVTDYSAYSIHISLFDEVFGNNTWESIQSAVQSGIAASYWSVGDTKAVTLNGGVVGLTFSNETYYAFIIGFDHNQSYEGTNKLHMMLGKTSGGTQVAFYSFYMNSSATAAGGWNGSYMRGTIMPAFKATFPSDLKAVLGSCTKYTHNTAGGSSNDTSSNVTATTETVFLLAEYEVFGARTYANSYEKNKQAQYAYFKNGNSKVFYRHSSTGTACYWWLRSPICSNTATSIFCLVHADSTETNSSASSSYGVAPAFIIS